MDDFEILRFSLLSSILGASSPMAAKSAPWSFLSRIFFLPEFFKISAHAPFHVFAGEGLELEGFACSFFSAPTSALVVHFSDGAVASLNIFVSK